MSDLFLKFEDMMFETRKNPQEFKDSCEKLLTELNDFRASNSQEARKAIQCCCLYRNEIQRQDESYNPLEQDDVYIGNDQYQRLTKLIHVFVKQLLSSDN